MKKLLKGIVEFHNKIRPGYRDTFARLALGQAPDALFIICSDSRVAPNVFASTDPGDLFVIRNVGNMVPPSAEGGLSTSDESEAAAIEFAVTRLNVKSIIVCGHSECGAMIAALDGREKLDLPNLRSWLRLADPALKKLTDCLPGDNSGLARHNRLSQLNVLEQLEHLKTYPVVAERIKGGQLTLHAWWFNIREAEVHAYDAETGLFEPIDEKKAAAIIEKLGY